MVLHQYKKIKYNNFAMFAFSYTLFFFPCNVSAICIDLKQILCVPDKKTQNETSIQRMSNLANYSPHQHGHKLPTSGIVKN